MLKSEYQILLMDRGLMCFSIGGTVTASFVVLVLPWGHACGGFKIFSEKRCV